MVQPSEKDVTTLANANIKMIPNWMTKKRKTNTIMGKKYSTREQQNNRGSYEKDWLKRDLLMEKPIKKY